MTQILTNFPPPFFEDPAWWLSIISVAVTVCGIAGWLIKKAFVEPGVHNSEALQDKLSDISADTKEVKEDLKAVSVQLATINTALASVSTRVDKTEERITRLEDIFFERNKAY